MTKNEVKKSGNINIEEKPRNPARKHRLEDLRVEEADKEIEEFEKNYWQREKDWNDTN